MTVPEPSDEAVERRLSGSLIAGARDPPRGKTKIIVKVGFAIEYGPFEIGVSGGKRCLHLTEIRKPRFGIECLSCSGCTEHGPKKRQRNHPNPSRSFHCWDPIARQRPSSRHASSKVPITSTKASHGGSNGVCSTLVTR